MSDPDIDAAVRREVARSALRRLRDLVQAEAAQEAENARWAKRLAPAFAAAALAAVLWLAFR